MLLGKVHGLFGKMPEVGAVRSAIVVVGLSKDENVLAAPERILEDGGRSKVYIRVMTGCLIGGRPVKIPDAKLGNVFDRLDECLRIDYQRQGMGVNIIRKKSVRTGLRSRIEHRP